MQPPVAAQSFAAARRPRQRRAKQTRTVSSLACSPLTTRDFHHGRPGSTRLYTQRHPRWQNIILADLWGWQHRAAQPKPRPNALEPVGFSLTARTPLPPWQALHGVTRPLSHAATVL